MTQAVRASQSPHMALSPGCRRVSLFPPVLSHDRRRTVYGRTMTTTAPKKFNTQNERLRGQGRRMSCIWVAGAHHQGREASLVDSIGLRQGGPDGLVLGGVAGVCFVVFGCGREDFLVRRPRCHIRLFRKLSICPPSTWPAVHELRHTCWV